MKKIFDRPLVAVSSRSAELYSTAGNDPKQTCGKSRIAVPSTVVGITSRIEKEQAAE